MDYYKQIFKRKSFHFFKDIELLTETDIKELKNFIETLKPQALKKINSRLVLEAVVNAENIEVSEDELNVELNKLAETYKMELDKVNELLGDREKEAIKMDIAVGKAVDFVTDAAIEG